MPDNTDRPGRSRPLTAAEMAVLAEVRQQLAAFVGPIPDLQDAARRAAESMRLEFP